MAYPPIYLQRSPEQRLLDLNGRYDRVLKFYDAAGDAEDGTPHTDVEAKSKFKLALNHAIRMLREIQAEAYIVPATTIRAIALKARIMSEAKKSWWDVDQLDEDADARVLIEDILALAGLDRIHSRSFEFSDLLAGYDGPKLFEQPTTVPETFSTRPAALVPSSSFWTEAVGDADYDHTTHPEGALIQFAASVATLQEREYAAWDGDVEQPEADGAARALSAALKDAMHELAQQPARTPEGLGAKAGILVAIKDWGQDGFGELALSVAKDAAWIATQSRFQLSHLDAMSQSHPASQVAA